MASTGAVNRVELTTVVASAEPFHCTTAPAANPAPFTVRVKAGPPAVALLGLRDVRLGVTVKFTGFEVTPPEITVMLATPAIAIRFAGTLAVTWPVFTTVVVSAVAFHCTTESEAKPLPFTVSVNAGPPAAVVVGLMLVIAGGGRTVNVTAFEVSDPDTTVT